MWIWVQCTQRVKQVYLLGRIQINVLKLVDSRESSDGKEKLDSGMRGNEN